MGYPVEMIGKDTKLFSIIGESAIESKKESLFNDIFKEKDLDMMVMPLNIRNDDLGYFLYNFKNSKVSGAYFQKEYWQDVCHLLKDEIDDEAKVCGIVDSLDVVDGKNRAYVVVGEAISSLFEFKDKRVGICGDTPMIKSALYHLKQKGVDEFIFYDDIIERTLELTKIIDGCRYDVIRVEGSSFETDTDILLLDRDDLSPKGNSKVINLSLEFDKIEKEIAKIKTREWIENG